MGGGAPRGPAMRAGPAPEGLQRKWKTRASGLQDRHGRNKGKATRTHRAGAGSNRLHSAEGGMALCRRADFMAASGPGPSFHVRRRSRKANARRRPYCRLWCRTVWTVCFWRTKRAVSAVQPIDTFVSKAFKSGRSAPARDPEKPSSGPPRIGGRVFLLPADECRSASGRRNRQNHARGKSLPLVIVDQRRSINLFGRAAGQGPQDLFHDSNQSGCKPRTQRYPRNCR